MRTLLVVGKIPTSIIVEKNLTEMNTERFNKTIGLFFERAGSYIEYHRIGKSRPADSDDDTNLTIITGLFLRKIDEMKRTSDRDALTPLVREAIELWDAIDPLLTAHKKDHIA